jgi:hypothetical protein
MCMDRLQRLQHPQPTTVGVSRLAAVEIAQVWGLDDEGERRRLAKRLEIYFSVRVLPSDADRLPE